MNGVRTLVLWCPDWPVVAAGLTDGVAVHEPVAVMHANRVLACSPAARAEGVRRGLRRREAQSRCPQLIVIGHDPGRDARAFEQVVVAVEALAPGVEVLRPGMCAVAARGPSSYFGGEEAAAERIVEHIAVTSAVEAQAGIADGVFAATLAARAGRLIPAGGSAAFLAGMDISTLEATLEANLGTAPGSTRGRPALADLLRRLGVRTLGDFAALPAGDVAARFGFAAAHAHRLAAGRDERGLAVRRPPPDLEVSDEYDPPLERVDAAAFAARTLAGRLHERLSAHGLAATRLSIQARTAAGEAHQRTWRHDGLLDAAAIADRVRWQLDGWLTQDARASRISGTSRGANGTAREARPTAGISRLCLIPDGVIRHAGMQPGLWGELGEADERAHRALVRVQGLLGPDSVYTAVLGGGRGYADRVRLVAWGDERGPGKDPAPPWPGRLPAPAPATVLLEPAQVTVRTGDGAVLGVDARLAMTGAPASVVLGSVGAAPSPARCREPPVEVIGWAGPWPVEERWWAPGEANRLVRLQLLLADGRAVLVASHEGQWIWEASYD